MNWQIILSKILDEIKRNKNITQVIAKVESPPSNLTLKYAEQVIPSKQIYCSNYLLPHYHRNYKIDGIIDNIELTTREISGTLKNISLSNSTSTNPAGEGPHSHEVPSINASGSFESSGEGSGAIRGNGTYQSHKDLWLEDTLKQGDEVLVNIVGVHWVVVSKITKMPSGAIEGV